jgi:hypothetical protein
MNILVILISTSLKNTFTNNKNNKNNKEQEINDSKIMEQKYKCIFSFIQKLRELSKNIVNFIIISQKDKDNYKNNLIWVNQGNILKSPAIGGKKSRRKRTKKTKKNTKKTKKYRRI